MKFEATIDSFVDNGMPFGCYIRIPDAVYQEIIPKCIDKRLTCAINKLPPFACGMMPKDGFHFISINKERLKAGKFTLGDTVLVNIEPDISKYGMPISPEMEEVLFSDPDGSVLFHKLTPGKIRSLLFYVNKIKTTQLKIEKSFVILEHLKKNKGALDNGQLAIDFKNYKNNFKF